VWCLQDRLKVGDFGTAKVVTDAPPERPKEDIDFKDPNVQRLVAQGLTEKEIKKIHKRSRKGVTAQECCKNSFYITSFSAR